MADISCYEISITNEGIFYLPHAEKIKDRNRGKVAVDAYHRYKEHVNIMKEMGMDAYRFSISWSRILPNGRLSGGVNKEGVAYYNHLIDELLSKGLKPFVTLFHWDSPQGLEDLYGGFRSSNIVKDFVDYAEVRFREFGDRVKHWITFNEPWTFYNGGYVQGFLAPGGCSSWVGNCSAGDSGREPYTVCHHQLLAHAAAVELYRDKYQDSQKGIIGITIISHWFVPFRNSKADDDAAERALDFMYGWFMDPLTRGDYPFTENGVDEFNNASSTLAEALKDDVRIAYYQQHLQQVRQAIREGVDVRGFFAWSLMDNFEWSDGFTVRFGIYYVDYKNGLKRYPKSSAHWFRKFLKGG